MTAILVPLVWFVAGAPLWAAATGRRRVGTFDLGPALLIGALACALWWFAVGLAGVPMSPVSTLLPPAVAGLGLAARLGLRPARRRARGAAAVLPFALVGAASIAVGWIAHADPVLASDGMHHFVLPARVRAAEGALAAPRLRALTDGGHVHYPPLLGAGEAIAFQLVPRGRSPSEAARWLAPLFATAALCWGCLALRATAAPRRPAAGLAAGTVVAATPAVWTLAADGFADPLLAAGVLACGIELRGAWSSRSPRRGGWPLALLAAVPALTKQEGVLLALAVALGLAWRRRPAPALALAAAALAWPVYAGVAALPPESRIPWAQVASADALLRVPAVLADLAAAAFATGVHGVPAFGALGPLAALALAAALWRQPRVGVPLALAGLAHALTVALPVAATASASQVPTGWATASTATRLLLPMLVWPVLAMPVALDPRRRGR